MTGLCLAAALCLACGGGSSTEHPDLPAFVARANYGAKLEMPDRVYHGAGQNADAFAAYWEVFGSSSKPAFYMAYLTLDGNVPGTLAALKTEIDGYAARGVYLMVQLGLSMTVEGTPSAHYEGAVADGDYDGAIDALCDGLIALGHPVLLRIGYEFNGTSWNGYEPTTYIAAFQRIHDRLEARGVEAATVWDATSDQNLVNWIDFYPGDEYVDWWGINLFSGAKGSSYADFFAAEEIHAFLDDAESHGKPVLIGESTPRYAGVGQGQVSWDTWFGPYFSLIAEHRGIKGFSYIDWNWADYPQWPDWGDARIENDPVVASYFEYVVSGTGYWDGAAEPTFRKALTRSTDHDAPPAPSGAPTATWSASKSAVRVAWNAVSVPDFLRYDIYIDGVALGHSVTEQYLDGASPVAGASLRYTVRTIDSSGNESADSQPSNQVVLPSPLQKARNRDFESGTGGWNLSSYDGAAGTFSLDTATPISGSASGKVVIAAGGGTNWYLQLDQTVLVHQGRTYALTAKMRGSAAGMNVSVFLQQAHEPYGGASKDYVIGTAVTSMAAGDVTWTAPQDDTMVIAFMFGAISSGTFTVDDVSLTEE
jgi:hypothetical protein